jgi:hypothetical protein
MNSSFTKYCRTAVLAMMILLSGMASMVCLSYDTDGDESTPPITVEINGIIPNKKSTQLPEPRSIEAASHSQSVELTPAVAMASVEPSFAPQLDSNSLPLLVPLRR